MVGISQLGAEWAYIIDLMSWAQIALGVYMFYLATRFVVAPWSKEEEHEIKPVVGNPLQKGVVNALGNFFGLLGPGARQAFHDIAGGFDWPTKRQIIAEEKANALEYLDNATKACDFVSTHTFVTTFPKPATPDAAALAVAVMQFVEKLKDAGTEVIAGSGLVVKSQFDVDQPLYKMKMELAPQLVSASQLSEEELRKATNDAHFDKTVIDTILRSLNQVFSKENAFNKCNAELQKYCLFLHIPDEAKRALSNTTPDGADAVKKLITETQAARNRLKLDIARLHALISAIPAY